MGHRQKSLKSRAESNKVLYLPRPFFEFFASMPMKHAFRDQEGDIFIHSRTDGGLYNAQRPKAKTKVSKVMIKELLFADDATVVSHSV
jgi:hypothetical protein